MARVMYMGERRDVDDVPLILVDYHRRADTGGVLLSIVEARASIQAHAVTLCEGMALRLWSPDHHSWEPFDALVTEATAHRSPSGEWVAVDLQPDFYLVSELSGSRDHWAHRVDWLAEEALVDAEIARLMGPPERERLRLMLAPRRHGPVGGHAE